MGYLKKVVTYDFSSNLVKLSWQEIVIAIERQIVTRQFAIDFAMDELGKLEEYPDALLELASLNKDGDIHPYIDDLAKLEKNKPDVNGKLLFVLLAWIYENKDLYDDPLDVVEDVYADFNYPSEINSFIKFMPSSDPDLGSVEKNCARLLEKWNFYLKEQKDKYK
jgi:hypothetical protein